MDSSMLPRPSVGKFSILQYVVTVDNRKAPVKKDMDSI